MIIKVQRAMYGSPMILLYSEPQHNSKGEVTHEIWAQMEMTEDEIQEILGDDLKGYFDATMDGDTMIGIGERVADQDW